ncbi:hypothetical protein NOR_08149 [Metarhizium rileyi]|uniref:Rhodopsin domain-containing protein n=1 Tax=Metarhizium rileyi (strain RCEF 4871) TaxID=1649241 RepID=A0A166WST5_METRR|nr:hypothetical protein NOR_08149 [Metarhizium rileyi RCEF 4871]TWU71689.1 hypothetical protein ED733_002264 [Metarhizium rileyi]
MYSPAPRRAIFVLHWVFSCLTILVMTARLLWRKAEKQSFVLGDHFTMGAIVCALIRLALIHVVLEWGTNNVPNSDRLHHNFTPIETYQREIGSKLKIANRFFYNSYLWLQKLVLLDLYRRLLLDLAYEKIIIRGYLIVFLVSFVAVQVITFTECRPFRLYWQVVPDPGPCAQAPIQLLTLGSLNIVTDLMLLILPIPVVALLRAPWRRKLQLYALFTLGGFIVLVTIVRLPINYLHIDSQGSRTTWASTELLTTAIVVNAPSLYGLWNKHRRDKVELHRRKEREETRRKGNGPVHPDTIGGSNEFCEVQRKSKPTARGLLPTKGIEMTDAKEKDGRHSRESWHSQRPDIESASQHSSEREILHLHY